MLVVQCNLQLRALAVEDALTVDVEPDLVQAAGHCINLDAQRRHRPGVQDVGGRDQHTNQGVGGEHQALVHLQHTQLPWLDVLQTCPCSKCIVAL